jgi:hypothetical protein
MLIVTVRGRLIVAAGQSFLQELREFLRFLRSLWGLLASISVLFPLSNVMLRVIPIAGGGNPFQNLSPGVVTTLTTLTCIFLTFATFGRRSQFSDPRRRRRYATSARIAFVGAIGALAVYLLTPRALYPALITNNPNSELGIALYDGLFAALYIASFALLTRAFLLLAMLEYIPQAKTKRAAASSRS